MEQKKPILIGILICLGLLWGGVEIVHRISKNQIPPEESVLAYVGNKTITVTDLETHFYLMRPDSQRYYATQENRRILLNFAIGDKLRALLAEKMGYDRLPNVQINLQQVEKTFPSDRRPWQRDLILARLALDYLYSGELAVHESEIRRYYNFHKEKYENALILDASRIFLPTEQDLKHAQDLLKKGVPFAHVANMMSRDRFAGSGGRMQPLIVSIQPSLEERILLFMQAGQVSPPMEEDGGYVILKLNARRKATLADAKAEIEQTLHLDKLADWIKRHEKQDNVRIDEQLLTSLELRPPK